MDASKLDRQKEEQLKKEEARQNAEAIARHYGDIKRGVAMVQDAADSGTKILNSHLLNLLEEPLEKLQKLIEYIDPIEYSDNLVKQKGYLVSSLDKLDASLKERVGGIIGQFDFLIGKLSSDVKRKKLYLALLERILASDSKYMFSVEACSEKGIDFNELIDCKLMKLPKEYESLEKISIFGACLEMAYPQEFIIRLLNKGADIGKACELYGIDEENDVIVHKKFYPLWFLCLYYRCFDDSDFLSALSGHGFDLNSISVELYSDDPGYCDNEMGVLKEYLRVRIGNYDDDEVISDIRKMQSAGLYLNSKTNVNMHYSDSNRKYTITDYLLSKYPLKRNIHKLFIGCDFDKNPILEEVTGAKIYGSYNGYLESKNYLLFLINNDVDALSDFSYRLRYSDGDSSFTGSLIGLFVFNVYDSEYNESEVYGKLRRDLTELLLRLKIDFDWVALKYENGNEVSFREIMSQS